MLASVRQLCAGELICVVGCGGDRDPGKRGLMAQAASDQADVVWLTSDNPRSEDPESIIAQMRAGLGEAAAYECVDRLEAIGRAIAGARADDIVVIAGKGHEDYQEVAGERLPFSDVEAAAAALEYWSDPAGDQRLGGSA